MGGVVSKHVRVVPARMAQGWVEWCAMLADAWLGLPCKPVLHCRIGKGLRPLGAGTGGMCAWTRTPTGCAGRPT